MLRHPTLRIRDRRASDPVVIAAVLVAFAVFLLAPVPALAQSTDMPGQQLLQFARNYIIAPIALFAIIISGVAAFIRPEMIKASGYVAIIAVILYFLLANANRLLQVMRAG
jgi:hypothetical protein